MNVIMNAGLLTQG